MNTLDAVLDRIDHDLEASLERLFALLRIKSISTDPAYQEQCRTAAEHLAKDLASLGFDSNVRPTARPSGSACEKRERVARAFCSTVTTMCSPSTRWNFGRTRRSNRASRPCRMVAGSSSRVALATTKAR